MTGTGPAKPTSRARRVLSNAVTVLLLVICLALFLRKLGVLRH